MSKQYHLLMQYQSNTKVMALAQTQANLRFTGLTMTLLPVFFFFYFLGSLVWRMVAGG